MLRRSLSRFAFGPQRSRASNLAIRPLFKTAGAAPLYAAKQKATAGEDSKESFAKLVQGFRRLLTEKVTAYYLLATAILGSALALYMMKKEEYERMRTGLAGPPKRAHRSRLTIVLDVDETLVSYGDKAYRLKAGLVPRPFLAELLDFLVSIDAEVILWSSCSEGYMMEVMSAIDPTRSKISTTITRNSSWFTADNYYEKNALWLNRDMNNTLIIENRALAVRNCNSNAILVDDFIRGEYVDTGIDLPRNDHALHTLKSIIADLERTGRPVPEYLADVASRNPDIKEIPCERAIRQLRDEIARGVFYFIGDKYIPGSAGGRLVSKSANNLGSSKV